MPLLSQEAKEICHYRYDSHQLLQMHHRKHPFWLYHSLVWLRLEDCKKLQSFVNEAQSITQTNLPPIDTVYTSCCSAKAASLIKETTHHRYKLFHLVLSEKKRLNLLMACTNRLIETIQCRRRPFDSSSLHRQQSQPGPIPEVPHVPC